MISVGTLDGLGSREGKHPIVTAFQPDLESKWLLREGTDPDSESWLEIAVTQADYPSGLSPSHYGVTCGAYRTAEQ